MFASEHRLLEQRGHEVRAFKLHNDQVDAMGKLQLARATIWNRDAYAQLRDICRGFKPDIAHFHNTFPLISPAGYQAARDAGAAVVQTLHNYRLLCAGATFYRNDRVCEDCLAKRIKWPAAMHKCYRGNRGASAVTAAMLTWHHVRGTYRKGVDRYIALSDFARAKFIEGGLPADKIVVKPNFVDPDPGAGDGSGGYALFVGRLTVEKGIQTLLDAWAMARNPIPLKIVGDGPLRGHVEAEANRIPGVEYLGRKAQAEVAELMGGARALIFPSVWYEGMPRTIIESFAKGTPVVASDLGTMSSMIVDGINGVVFTPGDAQALALIAGDAPRIDGIPRERVRQSYLELYSGESNGRQLEAIYESAIAAKNQIR